MTGKTYGEKRTATTQMFHNNPITWKGLLKRPKLHFGFGNLFGVKKSLPKQMSAYAAAEGTPAAETSDVKATADGKMVQVMIEETTQTTMTALRGWLSTMRATQGEYGRTPSRATAKTSREAASTAMAVFWSRN